MAETFTRFEPITTGANSTVKNALPLKAACTAFQYRKRISAFVSFGSFDTNAGGAGVVIAGNWKERVHASPGGTVLFEQEVTVRFGIVVQMFGPDVGSFLWFPLDSADAYKRETTICDGQAVPVDGSGHHEGWRFVDTPKPDPYSEQGDVRAGDFDDVTDDDAATSTFTVDGGYIDATFQSARYNCNIPAGAVLEVVFDHWQFANLREATYSFAFKGSSKLSAIWDRVGAYRTARPFQAGTLLEHRFPGAGESVTNSRARAFYEGVNNACLCKTRDNALWILGQEATKGKLWVSEDDGTTKSRLTRKTPEGTDEEVIVFGDGFEMIDLMSAPGDGTMWALGTKNNLLYLANSRDDWVNSKELGQAKSPPYAMGIARDGTVLVASATHELEYDGTNITERPAPLPTNATPPQT